MKSFRKLDLVRVLIIYSLIALLPACGGGGSSSSEPPPKAKVTITINGVAQKGPLVKNSTVTAQELNSALSPTGKQYSYQITDDLGRFAPDATQYSSLFIGLNANGYYYDEVLNAVSTGPLALQGIADLNTDTVMNVNLLSTLAYNRIKTLVDTGMTIAAARTQAEAEVLKAFYIYNGNAFGSFGSLDIAQHRDGDNILAAISSLFVNGNNVGNLSQLIANFQSDLADNGIIDTAATTSSLAASAQSLSPATVAANLTAKYTGVTTAYASTDISDWIDQDGDGVIGRYKAQVTNAGPASTYTLPSAVVDYLAGQSLTISAGQITINGAVATGAFTLVSGDAVVVSPTAGMFPAGVFTIYLKSGATNLARVNFIIGLSSIAVTPANPNVPKGLTTQLTATGTFTDSSTADLTNNVTWSTATTAATINATGLASGSAVGSSLITATSGVISGSTTLTISAAVVQSIAITPANPYTGVGYSELLTATGTFTDASKLDITNSVTWDTAASSVASVSASGVVAGVTLGPTLITATSSNAVVGSTTFTVSSNPWSAAASMVIGRRESTATLLANGKVLVAGGAHETAGFPPVTTPYASAELYDPATNTWTAAGSMTDARYQHTAALLANGKVLVVGGIGGLGWLASAELYDPATNAWSAAGTMALARTQHTATLLSANGMVLVAGGSTPLSITATAELYDPATNAWSPAPTMTQARYQHTATVLGDGKVLMAGSWNVANGAEIYDPAVNTWTTKASMNAFRGNHAATLLANGKVLVVGGSTSSGAGDVTTELYDPNANTWSLTTSMSTGRQNPSATLLASGKVLVVGGINTSVLSSAELYDPGTNTWTAAGNMSAARMYHSALLLANGKVLIVGGWGSIGTAAYTPLSSTELSWRW